MLHCTFTGWKDHCVLLRCAFDMVLFVPTSGKIKVREEPELEHDTVKKSAISFFFLVIFFCV